MAIDLLVQRAIDPTLLLTHVFTLDEAEKAFQTLTNPDEKAIKVVLKQSAR